MRDHQWIEESHTVDVPWADRELAVEFSTFRDKLRPGARETWRVTVKGEDGAAVAQAELLAYMYDRSLDLFAPHRPARVLDLFPRRASLPQLTRSLHAAGAHDMRSRGWAELPEGPQLIGDRLIFSTAGASAAWACA